LPYPHTHRRIEIEPRWRPIERFTSRELPPACRTWLSDDGSLTGRLIELNLGKFRVQRLYQGWQVPLPSERKILAQPPRQLALVREVILCLAEQPVVFARSVFPISSLTGSLAHLRRLQNTSLGAILFRHPGMHRSPFELAHMRGDSAYLPHSLRQDDPAWGRRSRFDISGKGLLVSEVFLQGFTPWRGVLPIHRTQRGKVSAAIVPTTQ
jgi:chorismate--pyruvate lyase